MKRFILNLVGNTLLGAVTLALCFGLCFLAQSFGFVQFPSNTMTVLTVFGLLAGPVALLMLVVLSFEPQKITLTLVEFST